MSSGADPGLSDDPDELPEAPRLALLADADRPGGWLLLMDRVRQSYVDLDDPTFLDFEYMRWVAAVLSTRPDGPLAITHIGGGAAALPRYLSAVRPGSTHIVYEPDTELTELVRSRLPLPREARIRIRPRGGREGLAELKDASADVIMLDAFAGGRVPAELTTLEAAGEAARVLRPDGLLIGNVGDGGPITYTRRVLAAWRAAFGHVGLVTDKAVLSGRRFGNVLLLASREPIDAGDLRRALAGEPFPATVSAGVELDSRIGGAVPFTDADSARSPEPPEASWKVEL